MRARYAYIQNSYIQYIQMRTRMPACAYASINSEKCCVVVYSSMFLAHH